MNRAGQRVAGHGGENRRRDSPPRAGDGYGSAPDSARPLRTRRFGAAAPQAVEHHVSVEGKAELTEREVSPQRLVHYRENWYLDAWCHLRKELRNFEVDSIQRVEVLEKAAKSVSKRSVEEVLGPGYCIFTGMKVQSARLAFTPLRARWVASEQWHLKQKGHFDDAGRYILELPYADHRELIMDILKYGSDVEVLAPESLRHLVREEHERAAGIYATG